MKAILPCALALATLTSLGSFGALKAAEQASSNPAAANSTDDGISYNRLVGFEEAAATTSTDAACNCSDNSAAACNSCDCKCCPDNCCNDCCYCPVWTIRAGAVIMNRSTPAADPIVVPTAGPGVISNGADFDLGWEAGPDVSITRRMASGNSWQVRYFGALDWNSPVVDYGAVGNVRIGSFSNFGATDLNATYNSQLNSAEINWLHPWGDRVTWLVGFRWLELQDNIRYHITFPAFTANYDWNEDNHLYGAQLGTDLNLGSLTGPLTIDCVLKAGVYGNAADNDFSLRPSTGGLFTGGGSGTDTAFVGEIGVTMAYQFTNHLAVRGGYQLLFIDGVALSSNQAAIATANSSQVGISSRGDVFYHGALMSVDVMW